MKRILLGLVFMFFISSNALSFDKLKFDPLAYQLGMTYYQLKEKGKEDGFFFRDFSATTQTLEEKSNDTFVSATFCEGSNYDGKAFRIVSTHYWKKEESLDFLLKYREFVLGMTGGTENVVTIDKESEEDKTYPGLVVTRDLPNGETWELSNQKYNKTYGKVTLVRKNLAVCE